MNKNYLSASMAKSLAAEIHKQLEGDYLKALEVAVSALNSNPMLELHKEAFAALERMRQSVEELAEPLAKELGAKIRFNENKSEFYHYGFTRSKRYWIEDIASRLQIEFNINGKTLDEAKELAKEA